MANEKSQIKKLRQRFVKDYNLPINIFEEKYFEYYKDLYPFFPKDVWASLVKKVGTEFNGNVDSWLNYCATVRDSAILGTMNTPEYVEFNTCSIDRWNLPTEVPNVGEHSIYNEECDGRFFLSIDLKKANFQALKYAGVINDETYADFIHRHGGDDYIANSKYLRQVIFGKMNPGRTVKVEKYLMGEIYFLVKSFLEGFGYELYSINSDELIFAEKNYAMFDREGVTTNTDRIVSVVKNSLDIDVRVEYILVKRLNIVNANGNKVDAYVKHIVNTGEEELKKASTTFYPQIYKLWKGGEINLLDRGFFFEDQIAAFYEPLRLIEEHENFS